MEELHQTAFAYYKDAPDEIRKLIQEFMAGLDPHGTERVSLPEFLEYMAMHEDCRHMSTRSFFDDLKNEGSEELDFMCMLTLFYIVYSGRPFCNGYCTKFIKGSIYFTCVKCFDNGHAHTNTFNVCTDCYVGDKYDHGHNKFLDNFVLLQTKRPMEAANFNHHHRSSSMSKTHDHEYGSGRKRGTRNSSFSSSASSSSSSLTLLSESGSSTSNEVVPVNPRPKNSSVGRKALKTMEVLLALGNIFASTQCTIM